MRTYGFSFNIDGKAETIKADNVFQARMRIIEKFFKEAYVVWEIKHGLRV